jgi:hypothetical protein
MRRPVGGDLLDRIISGRGVGHGYSTVPMPSLQGSRRPVKQNVYINAHALGAMCETIRHAARKYSKYWRNFRFVDFANEIALPSSRSNVYTEWAISSGPTACQTLSPPVRNP